MAAMLAILVFATYSSIGAPAALPPDVLIRENVEKADAIVEGRIVFFRAEPNRYAETRLTVSRVFRGPFHVGDEVTYYSFREITPRSEVVTTADFVVFLVRRMADDGTARWATAIDFSEFPSSPELEHKLLEYQVNHR
jgi:hypothetical protein